MHRIIRMDGAYAGKVFGRKLTGELRRPAPGRGFLPAHGRLQGKQALAFSSLVLFPASSVKIDGPFPVRKAFHDGGQRSNQHATNLGERSLARSPRFTSFACVWWPARSHRARAQPEKPLRNACRLLAHRAHAAANWKSPLRGRYYEAASHKCGSKRLFLMPLLQACDDAT